jgi:hypothetical protein
MATPLRRSASGQIQDDSTVVRILNDFFNCNRWQASSANRATHLDAKSCQTLGDFFQSLQHHKDYIARVFLPNFSRFTQMLLDVNEKCVQQCLVGEGGGVEVGGWVGGCHTLGRLNV